MRLPSALARVAALPALLCLLGAEAPPPARPPLRPASRLFDERDGLPQNTVEAIAQDTEGFLWVGTQEGAARYDGRRWKVLDMPNPTRSNWVSVIRATAQGVWFGTVGDGVHLHQDGRWQSFTAEGTGQPRRIDCLVPRRDGSLWVGTQDDGLWLLSEGRLVRQPEVTARRVSAVLEEEDQLLLGTEKGLLVRQGGKWRSEGPAVTVFDLLRQDDDLWMAAADGVYRQRGSGWAREEFAGTLRAQRLTQGPGLSGRHALWVATDRGVAFREQGRWQLLGEESGLPSALIESLLVVTPRSGPPQIWVGTFAGLVRWMVGRWNGLDSRAGPGGSVVFAVNATEDGTLWVGADGTGLFRSRGSRWEPVQPARGPRLQSVFALAAEGKRLWVGTEAQGVALFDGKELRWWEENGRLPSPSVYALLVHEERGRNVTWIGTREGLARWDGERLSHFDTDAGLPHHHVTALLSTRTKSGEEQLWVGTRGGGIALLRDGKLVPLPRNVGPMVNGLSEQVEPDGHHWVWVGCAFGGAFRLNPDDLGEPWLHLDAESSPALPSPTVYQVRADGRGRVFFFTAKGVARLDPSAGEKLPERLRTYTATDGLPSNGCTMGSSFLDPQGRLWTGTVAGAAWLDLSLDRDDTEPKPLRLLRAEAAADKPITSGASLGYREARLRFEFALLDYHRESDVLYRTQLVGLDAEPSPWRPEGSVAYPVLPAGRYQLLIWGRDHAGNESGPLAFSFRIRPPPWLHSLAFLCYALLLAGLVWLVVQWRSAALERRNRLLARQVDEATREVREQKATLEQMNQDLTRLNAVKNDFMAMAAHDLRNPLTGILIDAELLEDEREPAAIQETRGRIVAQVKIMQELISRLLNANAIEEGTSRAELCETDLRPIVADSVGHFVGRAGQKEIGLVPELPEGPVVAIADPHLVREVLDNLISNAVKFSPPGRRVFARLEAVDGVARITVRDEGPGFTEEDKRRLFGRYVRLSARPSGGESSVGLGLSIVKQMVDAMEGQIRVQSEAGRGAAFLIELRRAAPRS